MAVDPLTYEKEATNTPLEVYEWDNVWWEQTNNTTAKRVLYIGDSISYCTRNVVTATANEEILVDGFATSKALDNPYFLPTLKLFMEQQPGRDAVLFNNGLHGWHLDEENGYRIGYRKMLDFLAQNANVPIWVLLSTDDASDADRNKRVIRRNEIARELAAEYGLPVIDLYELATTGENLHISDGVHFTAEGYQKFADCIVATLKKHFNMK